MSAERDLTDEPKISRFVVSPVVAPQKDGGYNNPIPVSDELPMSNRNSLQQLLVPAEYRASLIPTQMKNVCRHGSRANSIFCEFFKDSDMSFMDYSQEAAPRLEGYRNSLTMHSYMVRPSLDQLHEAHQEVHPSLSSGKGLDKGAVKFGWIKGVYIRCLLNIWGVMLFIRMGWMTGNCGIVMAIVIVLLSTVVTVITTLSMSAICTNGDVKGGGAYYMISRSLGPEFGGAVGIILFLANALSGAMYIVGAGETIRDILREYNIGFVEFPSGAGDVRVSGVILLVLMMTVTGIGMAFENKTQMILLFILLAAMFNYFIGACIAPSMKQKSEGFVGWSVALGNENMWSQYSSDASFVIVFAVFFPSVTGILAGANISGDLKDPSSAIPKGTLLSILTTSLSYIIVIIFLGFTFVREASGNISDVMNGTIQSACENSTCSYGLVNDNQVMKLAALYPPLIYAGTFAATLSSALVSIVSAPRILQALCVDEIIPWLSFLGKGYGSDNDPRRALALTFVISLGCTAIGDLNELAPYISNFFMAANGLINFSCFHASYVKSPGFRPGFRYYNKWLSLVGALLCAIIMFIMSWVTALITDVVAIAIYVYISKTCPDVNWGSSFQGYIYRNALYYLHKMNRIEDHVKNYRPAILALTGNASSRPQIVDLANHFTKDQGLLLCGHVSQTPQAWSKKRLLMDLNTSWLHQRRIKGFYTVIDSDSLTSGVSSLFQSVGIGKMRPNILMMGFKSDWESCDVLELLDYFNLIHETLDAHVSICILRMPGGTDFSSYLETADGLPLLAPMIKKTFNKKINMNKPLRESVALNLETVLEESSAPNTLDRKSAIIRKQRSNSYNMEPNDYSRDNKSSLKFRNDVEQPSNHVECEGEEQEGGNDYDADDEDMEFYGRLPPHILNAANAFRGNQPKGKIDVWWLYDTGGLTLFLPYILTTRPKFKDCQLRVFSVAQDDRVLSDEQLNLAALLHKFRISFTDLNVLSSVGEQLHQPSTERFEKIMTKFITRDEEKGSPLSITRDMLNTHKKKTNQQLRLREMLEKHSKDANLIFITLPLPQKAKCPAALYMAWLDILTYDMPPILLVRGNQTNVLTFYS